MIEPLHNNVVVRRIKAEETTRGGLHLPDSAQELPQEAIVLSVGPGARSESGERIPMDVSAGDRVLIGKYAGNEVKVNGEDVLIVHENEILARLGPDSQNKTAVVAGKRGRG